VTCIQQRRGVHTERFVRTPMPLAAGLGECAGSRINEHFARSPGVIV
jgi:hypothetical protein